MVEVTRKSKQLRLIWMMMALSADKIFQGTEPVSIRMLDMPAPTNGARILLEILIGQLLVLSATALVVAAIIG